MAGYDSPWMALGLREDGYPVLDPRDFRTYPGEVSIDELRKRVQREIAGGAGMTDAEFKRLLDLLNQRSGNIE